MRHPSGFVPGLCTRLRSGLVKGKWFHHVPREF